MTVQPIGGAVFMSRSGLVVSGSTSLEKFCSARSLFAQILMMHHDLRGLR
ncbi:hypothetical protein XCR_0168 [Xanthomonas campestris pv. raphani 756C]|nr:hypothetical protein XCR_0168 [Xanthomonas campestris pv. raphani 756C]